jgi:hypothetical protein
MEQTGKKARLERPTFPLVPVIVAGAFALFVLSDSVVCIASLSNQETVG